MTTKTLLSFVRRAVQDYDMIRDGDVIGVGISGGKDSLVLLIALCELKRFLPIHYSIRAIHVDLGFDGGSIRESRRICEHYGIPLHIVKTQISRVIFEERKEKNPCSLCSKMRRGALGNAARELGCNLLALGHHRDDVVETLLLNLFYAGRIATFEPTSYLDRSELTLIRPLIYLEEKDILYYCNKHAITPDESGCPADEKTHREEIKQLLRTLSKENRDITSKIFGAICRANVSTFREVQSSRTVPKNSQRSNI